MLGIDPVEKQIILHYILNRYPKATVMEVAQALEERNYDKMATFRYLLAKEKR